MQQERGSRSHCVLKPLSHTGATQGSCRTEQASGERGGYLWRGSESRDENKKRAPKQDRLVRDERQKKKGGGGFKR